MDRPRLSRKKKGELVGRERSGLSGKYKTSIRKKTGLPLRNAFRAGEKKKESL